MEKGHYRGVAASIVLIRLIMAAACFRSTMRAVLVFLPRLYRLLNQLCGSQP